MCCPRKVIMKVKLLKSFILVLCTRIRTKCTGTNHWVCTRQCMYSFSNSVHISNLVPWWIYDIYVRVDINALWFMLCICIQVGPLGCVQMVLTHHPQGQIREGGHRVYVPPPHVHVLCPTCRLSAPQWALHLTRCVCILTWSFKHTHWDKDMCICTPTNVFLDPPLVQVLKSRHSFFPYVVLVGFMCFWLVLCDTVARTHANKSMEITKHGSVDFVSI